MQTAIQQALTGAQAAGRCVEGRRGANTADPGQDSALIRLSAAFAGQRTDTAPGGHARRTPARQSPLLLHAFLAASMLYLLVFIGLPVVYNLVMSVQDVTLGNIVDLIRPFVGLENYRDAFADPSFRKVLLNSAIFVGVNVIAQVGIGLFVALFFAQRFPGAHFLRGLAALVLDPARAGRGRAVEMDLRHRIRRCQFLS